jgi:hypothetical protein
MNTYQIKFIIKFLSALLLLCVYSNSSFASSAKCIAALYKYGNEFTPEKFGKKVSLELTQEPNEYGKEGELIYFATYRSDESWLTIRECASCNPKKMTSGVYLVGNRSLPCGLKEGLSISQIVKILGEAGKKQDNEYLFYYPDETQNDIVAIHLVGGKMKALQLIYYQG